MGIGNLWWRSAEKTNILSYEFHLRQNKGENALGNVVQCLTNTNLNMEMKMMLKCLVKSILMDGCKILIIHKNMVARLGIVM